MSNTFACDIRNNTSLGNFGRELMNPHSQDSGPLTDDGMSQESVTKAEQIAIVEPQASSERLYNVFIKSVAWPAEGRGLLHVASPMVYAKEFKIRSAFGSYIVNRNDLEIDISRKGGSLSPSSGSVIAEIEIVPHGLLVESKPPEAGTDPTSASNPNELWQDVPKDSEGMTIQLNDILRFGSYKVKVVDVVVSPESLRARSDATTLTALKPFIISPTVNDTISNDGRAPSSSNGSDGSLNGGPLCRICFEGTPVDNPSNPLVSPCHCAGSLRYIHVDCLRRWLDGQLQVKQFDEGGGSYYIRTINCEICKSVYSKSIYESILIPRPPVPHIILEDFLAPGHPLSPSQPTSKIHIIPVAPERPIRIGRSKENDVVLSDISVSRIHALLMVGSDESLRLVDLNSKFGTFIKLPDKIFHHVNSPSPLRFLIGSCLMDISTALPGRFERILPERFLGEKGAVKLVKSRPPNDRITDMVMERRRNPGAPFMSNAAISSPVSPAATLNHSVLRSPLADDEPPELQLPHREDAP